MEYQYPPPRRPQPRQSEPLGWRIISTALPLAVLILGIVLLIRSWQAQPAGPPRVLHDPEARPRPVAARGELAADEQATIQIFRQSAPSVVHITTSQVRRDGFTFDLMEMPRGAGTGFVWDEKGHIVTNYHVIEGGSRFRVTLNDQTTYQAALVGAEPSKDLAVLKIDAPAGKLPAILVGRSSDLAVGQKVFAIGNPFGLDQTLTTGVISGLDRQITARNGRRIDGVVQTDAAINPGNSGGPLLDSGGRLIGVNTAILSPSGAYSGVGFAIPVDTVNRVVPQILRHGRVIRPGMGVVPFDDRVTRRFAKRGVMLLHVQPESAAERAGLRGTTRDDAGGITLGDVIVAIDGRPVNELNDLFNELERHKVGDVVTVTVIRGLGAGSPEKLELEVMLQALSAE